MSDDAGAERTAPRLEREPNADERAGMAWWNGLDEAGRSRWLSIAGTAVPADAWRAFRASEPGGR